MKITGTVRATDGIVSEVVIDREDYDGSVYDEIKALAPEGCTLLHVKTDR